MTVTEDARSRKRDGHNAAVRGLLVDVTPLRTSRSYGHIWYGSALTGVASSLSAMAVGLQVYDLTGDSLAVGIVGFVSLVPLVLLGLYGGSIVDAYDRRKVLVATIIGSTVIAVALGTRWQLALFLGLLVAQSSTALVLKYLTDRGEIDTPVGQLSTGILIFQDLCIVPIMLVLPFLAGTANGGALGVLFALGKAALVVAGVVVGARTVVPRLIDEILRTRSRELFLIAVILLGAVTALASSAAGASLALGAFLAGLVISESDYAHQALADDDRGLPFSERKIDPFQNDKLTEPLVDIHESDNRMLSRIPGSFRVGHRSHQ